MESSSDLNVCLEPCSDRKVADSRGSLLILIGRTDSWCVLVGRTDSWCVLVGRTGSGYSVVKEFSRVTSLSNGDPEISNLF